jgi:hypothetical protein
MIYVWNGFSIIGKRIELIQPVLQDVEKVINEVLKRKGVGRWEIDVKPMLYILTFLQMN